MRWTLLLLTLGCAACDDRAPYVEPDIAPQPVQAGFEVRLDPAHAAWSAETLEPTSAPVMITGGTEQLALHVFVKRPPNRRDVIWVELFAENQLDVAISNAQVTVTNVEDTLVLFDLGRDPFSDIASGPTLSLGGIAPRGISRVMFGIPAEPFPDRFTVELEGVTTTRVASSSSPIAITPDGHEAWVASPDTDVVGVIDVATDTRVASLAVPARPSSVVISSDGRFVLVASARANEISVFDRVTRELVQRFDESDGIAREPRNLVASPDGSHVYVASYVGDQITALVRRGDRYAVKGSLPVGRRPTGMSVSPDSRTLYVAHFAPRGRVLNNEAWLTRIDLARWQVAGEIVYADLLNLDRAHCLADVFGVSPERMTAEGVPNQLAGVFMNPSGNHAWIPHGVVPAIPVLERGPGAVRLSPAFDIKPGELAPSFVSLLDTRVAEQADIMMNPGVLDRPVSVDYMACADIRLTIEGGLSVALPRDPGQLGNQFAAFPSAYTGLAPAGLPRFVGFSRGGRYALVLSYISDTLAVHDAATLHPTSTQNLTLSGSQPIGLAVTPDGRKAYVAYESSLYVSVLALDALADPSRLTPAYVPYVFRDEPSLPGGGNGLSSERLLRYTHTLPERPPITEVARVTIADRDPLDAVTRRGKVLFSSSNTEKYPQLSSVTMTACASCHPDGTSDGTLWATMEGERRTMSLAGGVRDRGWLHISATHENIIEFANQVVRERLGGDPAADDIIAISKYVSDAIPVPQPPRTDAVLAARGRELFESYCAGCHQGTGDDPTVFDMGTAIDNAHVGLPTFFESLFPPNEAEILRLSRGDRALGPGDRLQQLLDFRQRPSRARGELKAPVLRGMHEQVLLFHDGRFERLEDAVAYMDEKLELSLTRDEIAAIVEYVRGL